MEFKCCTETNIEDRKIKTNQNANFRWFNKNPDK